MAIYGARMSNPNPLDELRANPDNVWAIVGLGGGPIGYEILLDAIRALEEEGAIFSEVGLETEFFNYFDKDDFDDVRENVLWCAEAEKESILEEFHDEAMSSEDMENVASAVNGFLTSLGQKKTISNFLFTAGLGLTFSPDNTVDMKNTICK